MGRRGRPTSTRDAVARPQRCSRQSVCADTPESKGPYAPYLASLFALAGDADSAVRVLASDHTLGSSYRYLVTEPTVASLKTDPGFQQLLEQRYYVWLGMLDQLEQGLPEAPSKVPSPLQFLTSVANGKRSCLMIDRAHAGIATRPAGEARSSTGSGG